MDVTTFFTRLLQPPKQDRRVKQLDDIADFDTAWTSVKETLEHPDERQLVKGIVATDVPVHLTHIVDALIYEAGHTDDETTGACLEYLLRHDLLANLERLCEADRPRGIKSQALKTFNDLIVALSERFLVHNAVHRPLRRLLRSCVGDEREDKVEGTNRVFGAAGMQQSNSASMSMDVETEANLLYLMSTLASRMRAYPPLLLIFFHDKGWLVSHGTVDPTRALSPTPSAQTGVSLPSSGQTKQNPHFEFLLFSYLLRYAHREGEIGDTARAGLLFLFDIAFLTESEEGGENLFLPTDKEGNDVLQDARDALSEYIVDGDFMDVMAAGLGAIYSLLPVKLKVPNLAEMARSENAEEGITASQSGGMHLGATLENDAKDEDDEIALSTDEGVRTQLDLLIRLLTFLEAIFQRCHSPFLHISETDAEVQGHTMTLGRAVIDYTLDAISTSFLDNIIYPSILECSPHDGSSVAVMTYLEAMFSSLEDGRLLQKMLGVLADTEDPITKTERIGQAQHYYAEEGRFTLKDLILDNIRSTSSGSATAAFRLLQTLLSSHCQHGVEGLIRIVRESSTSRIGRSTFDRTSYLPHPDTSADVHLQEVELYGPLITRIDPLQTSTELTTGYAAYLADVQGIIQVDPCFLERQIPLQFLNDEKDPILVGRLHPEDRQHRLSPGDPLVMALLELFGHFLCQTPDSNVALTGVLAALALCPNRSLIGWLVYDNHTEIDPWASQQNGGYDSESDGSEDARPLRPAQDADDPFSVRDNVELPALYQILRDLVRQVNRFRLDVDDFDRLLSERRQGLLFADHLDEAMNVLLDVEPSAYGLPSTPTKVEPPTPKESRPGIVGGLKSFLTPKRKATPGTAQGSAAPPLVGSTNLRQAASDIKSSSPFKSHYEQTTYFSLEAHTSSPIFTGPWSPARLPREAQEGGRLTPSRPKSALSGVDSTSVFSGDDRKEEDESGPRKVTLSSVLDNCVILEEFIKEIVAVITARRALGIDQVGFMAS